MKAHCCWLSEKCITLSGLPGKQQSDIGTIRASNVKMRSAPVSKTRTYADLSPQHSLRRANLCGQESSNQIVQWKLRGSRLYRHAFGCLLNKDIHHVLIVLSLWCCRSGHSMCLNWFSASLVYMKNKTRNHLSVEPDLWVVLVHL